MRIVSERRCVADLQCLALAFLLLARIVGGVDVVDAARPDEPNLDDRRLVACPNIMSVLCRVCEEGTNLAQLAFPFEFFAHAETDATADHCDGFRIGVRVWGNLVIGGELDALHDDCLDRSLLSRHKLITKRRSRSITPGGERD
jgi:hypothetical protein